MKNGILIINKPKGFTSFDVIAKIRKILKTKKIGHTGTLDPLATGVLVILIGRATKFQIFMENCQKKYIADIKFGINTTTQDITGKIISKKTNFKLKFNDLNRVIKLFEGDILQIPPMFSAIKKNGQRLYKLARIGLNINREPRKIFINKIKIIEFDEKNKTSKLSITCGSGTYIRTLCEDIGNKLRCGAIMTDLHRVESNGFKIDQSTNIEEVTEKNILPLDILFKNYDSINISLKQAERFKNGGNLSLDRICYNREKFNNGKILKLYCEDIFIGLGKIDLKNAELKFLKAI